VAVTAVAVYDIVRSFQDAGGYPVKFHLAKRIQWLEYQPPCLIAATVFWVQCLMSLGVVKMITGMPGLAYMYGLKFRRSIQAHTLSAFLGAVMYTMQYTGAAELILVHPVFGEYILFRFFHWTMSTPIQWFVFVQVCSSEKVSEMMRLFVPTIFVQIFGILMLFTPSREISFLCFIASSVAFVIMFIEAFNLELVQEMKNLGHKIRLTKCVVWSLYPIAVLARWDGIIGTWGEQVLIFTLCDMVAKVVTFSTIVLARMMHTMATLNGAVQLVFSTHDVIVVVDAQFVIIESPQVLPLIAYYMGDTRSGRTLFDFCAGQHDRRNLTQGALTADSQEFGVPPPKCHIAFRLPAGEEELYMECSMSRCMNGRRIIGLSLMPQEGINSLPQNAPRIETAAENETKDLYDNMSSVSAAVSQRNDTDMQLALALHNCSDVLQLAPQFREMLNALFTQPQYACALFFWDGDVADPDVRLVVVSPKMRELFFPGQNLNMPQPMASIFDDQVIRSTIHVMRFSKLVVHQQFSLTREGTAISVLPLSRLSRVAGSCSVKLGVMHVDSCEFSQKNTGTHHHFWYFVEGHLYRATAPRTHLVCPPITIASPDLQGDPPVWSVLLQVPGNGGEDLSDLETDTSSAADSLKFDNTVLAIPRHFADTDKAVHLDSTFWGPAASEALQILSTTCRPTAGNRVLPPEILRPLSMQCPSNFDCGSDC